MCANYYSVYATRMGKLAIDPVVLLPMTSVNTTIDHASYSHSINNGLFMYTIVIHYINILPIAIKISNRTTGLKLIKMMQEH